MPSRSPRVLSALTALTVAAGLLLPASGTAQGCDPVLTARYRVTFDATWSSVNHPLDFPAGAHWSGLIGGTHKDTVSFWDAGALASPGIESMAETGSKTLLTQEVNAAIGSGDAEFVLDGPGVGTSPGTASMEFDVSTAFPEVTLVTMIAPSPDWFAGVTGLDLTQGGRFVDELVVTLHAYDAGTDSGTTYTSANSNTNPPDPIAQITGYPIFGVPVGTFTFTRLSGECLGLCVSNLVAGQTATVEVTRGTPGETVAVLWSTSLGSYQAMTATWCVDFGIAVPGSPADRLVATGPFDGSGTFTFSQTVPAALQGRDFKFQAAERNTCPLPCMSNVVAATVQ